MASHPHATAQPKRRLLNLRDAATELDVSLDTIDRMLRRGDLPHVKFPSGRRRIDRADLERAITDWREER